MQTINGFNKSIVLEEDSLFVFPLIVNLEKTISRSNKSLMFLSFNFDSLLNVLKHLFTS